MAWTSVQVTLRCANSATFDPYIDVVLDCFAAVPVAIQDEAGEREIGVGAVLLQNIASREIIPLVVRKITVADDEFDYGHYQNAVKYFRAKHIRLQAVTGHDVLKGADEDGDAYTYYSTGLPRKVVVQYDQAELERTKGSPAQLGWAITLRDEKPTVGVEIPT